MPLKVIKVRPRSLAAAAGIRAGDSILSINSMPVRDFFDLELYANDYRLDFELLTAAGKPKSLTILRQSNKPLGIEPEPYKYRKCRNNCVFCFIDQLPPRLRTSLYQKDDDYLYSYTFGNYITLTNLRQADLRRIIEQRISPLYISIHTTDPALHQALMRHSSELDILPILRQLARSGIRYHAQIVLVPGYNDGAELRRSLDDLLDNTLGTLSVGVVPVGLTRFRRRLTPLQPVDYNLARSTLRLIDEFRRNRNIVYAGDELYILARMPIPEAGFYGQFPQLENGIGMLRLLQMNYRKHRDAFCQDLDRRGGNQLILTSRLAFDTLAELADDLNSHLLKARIRVQAIHNDFFGELVGVSGLLTACDLLSQHQARPDEVVIIPSNLFNHEGLSLDDLTAPELKSRLGRPLLVVDQFWEDWHWI